MARKMKVKVVESGEDLRVRVVNSGQDLDLQLVTWGEEKRVKIVNSGEDIKARVVDGSLFNDGLRINGPGGTTRIAKGFTDVGAEFSVRGPRGEISKLRKDIWGDWALHHRDGSKSRVTKDFFGDGWTVHNPDGSEYTLTKDFFGSDWTLKQKRPAQAPTPAVTHSPSTPPEDLEPVLDWDSGASSELRTAVDAFLNFDEDQIPAHYLNLRRAVLQLVGAGESHVLTGRCWETRSRQGTVQFALHGPKTSFYLITDSAAYVPITDSGGRHLAQRAPFARIARVSYGQSQHGFLTMDTFDDDGQLLVGLTFHPLPGNELDEVEQARLIAGAAGCDFPRWESSLERRRTGDGL